MNNQEIKKYILLLEKFEISTSFNYFYIDFDNMIKLGMLIKEKYPILEKDICYISSAFSYVITQADAFRENYKDNDKSFFNYVSELFSMNFNQAFYDKLKNLKRDLQKLIS